LALTRSSLEGHDETLIWADFQGSPPQSSGSGEAAYADARFDMSYDYVWDDSHGAAHGYRIDHVQVLVTLDRANMWSVKSARSDALLQHEQGHYDIVALVARDLYEELLGWNSGRSPKRFRREDDLTGAANRKLRTAKALAGQLAGTSSKVGIYDTETKHGLDAKAQERWTNALAGARANGAAVRGVLKGLGVSAAP
jgi:hypothetical protein